MLTGVHILLTYQCPFECDHCFLYCGPDSSGTFTGEQVRNLLDQAREMPSIETIYFKGVEAFLYYPLLVEAVRQSRQRGYRVGIVTNGYWATSEEDARLWLQPLAGDLLTVRFRSPIDFDQSDRSFGQGDRCLRVRHGFGSIAAPDGTFGADFFNRLVCAGEVDQSL